MREEAWAELAAAFGTRFSRAEAVRRNHASSVTWVPPEPPEAVLEAATTAEVQQAVRICARHRVPVIAFGTGTSVEGQVNAPEGGLCLSLRTMNRIIALNVADLDATVEAGVTREQLNAALRDHGLFFPVDPGADASLGGMAATRASGTNAVRYGTMRDAVLAVRAVLADGEVVTGGTRARKAANGYDLTRLLVGSEGTLGIITELTLRLHGIPESVLAGTSAFASVRGACDAVIEAIQSGLPLARVELLDAKQIAACNAYSRLGLPEQPHLFLELHGSPVGTADQAARLDDILHDRGGAAPVWAANSDERNRLWRARHESYWAAVATRPGSRGVSTDVCVPISRMAACVEETRADMDAHGIPGTIQGHVGDGNFHAIPLVDPHAPAEVAAMADFLDRLAARAHAAGGTCSGEHGIGQGRRKYMATEHGEAGLAMMRAIKTALDPLGILNPGKMLP
jgi:D-lactate dehydrogenase (cytochrome)